MDLFQDEEGTVFTMDPGGQPVEVMQDEEGGMFTATGAPVTEGQQQGYQLPEGQNNMMNAGLHGALQGVSLGFADEIEAAGGGYVQMYGDAIRDRSFPKPQTVVDSYQDTIGRIRSRFAAIREGHPITSQLSDVAGSIVSGVGAGKLSRYLQPKTVAGSTLLGAGDGAIQSYGRGDEDPSVADIGMDLAMGAAFGMGGHLVGEGIGRLKNSYGYTPDTPRIEQARELDIQLSPAQRYDDPALHKIEASMRADPGYSQAFEGMDAHNQTRANQILSNEWGIQSDKLTPDKTKILERNVSNKFKFAEQQGDSIDLSQTNWESELFALRDDYVGTLGKSDASIKVLADAHDLMTSGPLTPTNYQKHYSDMGKDMESARVAGDFHKMKLYRGIRQSLDNAVDMQATGLSQQFQEARDLYKVQKLAEKPGVVEVGRGDVSPLTLANQLNRSDKRGYFYGHNEGDLYKLARLAKSTRSGINDSGTGTRNKTLVDYLLSPAKASIGNLYTAGPLGTALTSGTSGVGRRASIPAAAGGVSLLETEEDIARERARRQQLEGLLSGAGQ